MEDMITPCYVVTSNGFTDTVSYKDDWCYGKSSYLGESADDDQVREIIKADIRRHLDERNGIPVYFVSDHGNVSRRRAIRLRRKA